MFIAAHKVCDGFVFWPGFVILLLLTKCVMFLQGFVMFVVANKVCDGFVYDKVLRYSYLLLIIKCVMSLCFYLVLWYDCLVLLKKCDVFVFRPGLVI